MAEDSHDSYIRKQIKNYTILRKLGSGGAACVYLARDHSHDLFAIKLLTSDRQKPQMQQLFFQEAQILQELKHNGHILPFLEYDEYKGIPYIVTEYAPGGTLREYLSNTSPITVDEVLIIINQLCQALDIVHRHNIVHCDLKPENIFFNSRNDVVLADFGIAIRLGTNKSFYGLPRGTYAYMAPEQFDGIFTKAGDQYALGCIAYELLTAKHPFEYLHTFDPYDPSTMKNAHKSAAIHLLKEFNEDIPDHIELAVLQALSKDPVERHSSIAKFAVALQQPASLQFQPLPSVLSMLNTPSLDSFFPEEISCPATDPSDNSDSSSLSLEVYTGPIECNQKKRLGKIQSRDEKTTYSQLQSPSGPRAIERRQNNCSDCRRI